MDREIQDTISTNESVARLALSLLKPQAGGLLLDICSGLGDFLNVAYKEYPKMKLYGIELNEELYRTSLSRLPKDVNIRFDDAFDAYKPEEKFDRIFCHSPWGVQRSGLMHDYKPVIMQREEKASLGRIGDWMFCDLICRQLADDGSGVAFIPLGNMFNLSVRSIREAFVKSGWIKSIILLPPCILETLGVHTVMVVFSKGNGKIRMVDARNIGMKGRRLVTYNDEDIAEILGLCETDEENSRAVGVQEIEENEYLLNPARYTTDLPSVPYAVPLGEVVTKITRGAGISSKERDELTSQEDNGVYFLTVSNIENGTISKNLSTIKEVSSKMSRYVLNDGDIVLSKNGAPFKSANYEHIGKTVLANGNIYVIRTDETLVNPHYLVAYFNSEIGQKHLENIGVGSTFLNLAVNDLKKLLIPLPPLDVQNEFVERFLQKTEELEKLKRLVNEKETDIKDMFIKEMAERKGDENI